LENKFHNIGCVADVDVGSTIGISLIKAGRGISALENVLNNECCIADVCIAAVVSVTGDFATTRNSYCERAWIAIIRYAITVRVLKIIAIWTYITGISNTI